MIKRHRRSFWAGFAATLFFVVVSYAFAPLGVALGGAFFELGLSVLGSYCTSLILLSLIVFLALLATPWLVEKHGKKDKIWAVRAWCLAFYLLGTATAIVVTLVGLGIAFMFSHPGLL